jgi:hypothetical protein
VAIWRTWPETAIYQSKELARASLGKPNLNEVRKGIKNYWKLWQSIPYQPGLGLIVGATIGIVTGNVYVLVAGLTVGGAIDGAMWAWNFSMGYMNWCVERLSAANPTLVGSWDPNDKAGPFGFDTTDHFMPLDEVFHYVVYFENESTATAEAEDIYIVDTLDANLDWSTFAFGSTSHSCQKSFNIQTGVVRWTFLDINLPPNVNPPEGEGWVSYTVKPKQGLSTGTRIENLAWVTFDYMTWACPMDSIPIFNTIDASPPNSWVHSLPDTIDLANFQVCWSGADDPLGSGIRDYAIHVSDNGGSYTVWLMNTASTCSTFTGINGHTYCFYSIARDNVGNIQDQVDSIACTRVMTAVEEESESNLPKTFSLSQNYPNPFNPQTVIQYALPHDCEVQIVIYNVLGQKVRTLVNEYQKAGYKRVEWDSKSEQGEEVASGIYFYRIHSGEFHQVKKMVVIK